MVCPRCVESVTSLAEDLHLPIENISIGAARFSRNLTRDEMQRFADKLSQKGFELAQSREEEIVEQVRTELIRYLSLIEEKRDPEKLSVYLKKRLNYNYSYLSQVYSGAKDVTIEQTLIKLKIERVKELLNFDKYTLSEIAWKLNYSSVQYLSNQFKSVTGITVTEYLNRENRNRISLDQI